MSDDSEHWATEARLNFTEKSLDRFASWVNAADSKIAAVLVLVGIGLNSHLNLWSGVIQLRDAHDSRAWSVAALYWLTLLPAVAALFCVIRSVIPRLTPGEESLAFFGTVAKSTSAQAYRDSLRAQSPNQLADQLAAQTWELARISRQKHKFVRLAVLAVSVFLVMWAISEVVVRQRLAA